MPTILLADDSVTIRKVVELTFAELGYTVLVAGDGDAAMQILAGQVPDIILADAVMPGKNGYDVCLAVKADPRLKHVPVLLLAGKFEPFDEGRAKQVGADAHIFKPFQGAVLVQAVTNLLASSTPPAPVVPASAVAPAPPSPVAPSPASAQSDTAQFGGGISAGHDPFASPPPFPIDEATVPSVSDHMPFAESAMPAPLPPDVLMAPSAFEAAPLAEPDTFSEPAPAFAEPAPEASPDPFASEAEPFLSEPTPEPMSEPMAHAPLMAEPQPFLAEPSAQAVIEPPAFEPPARMATPLVAPAPVLAEPMVDELASAAPAAPAGEISIGDFPEDVLEAIVQRLAKKISEDVVRDVVWQVVPELAELMIRKKLEELG